MDIWHHSEDQGSGIAVSCGVGRRRSSDPELQRLWCRPAATAPIKPLAWEPSCTVGAALQKTRKKKKSVALLAPESDIFLAEKCQEGKRWLED